MSVPAPASEHAGGDWPSSFAVARLVLQRLLDQQRERVHEAFRHLRTQPSERGAATLAAISRILFRLAFFRRIDPDVREELARWVRLQAFAAGDAIYAQDEPGNEVRAAPGARRARELRRAADVRRCPRQRGDVPQRRDPVRAARGAMGRLP